MVTWGDLQRREGAPSHDRPVGLRMSIHPPSSPRSAAAHATGIKGIDNAVARLDALLRKGAERCVGGLADWG